MIPKLDSVQIQLIIYLLCIHYLLYISSLLSKGDGESPMANADADARIAWQADADARAKAVKNLEAIPTMILNLLEARVGKVTVAAVPRGTRAATAEHPISP